VLHAAKNLRIIITKGRGIRALTPEMSPQVSVMKYGKATRGIGAYWRSSLIHLVTRYFFEKIVGGGKSLHFPIARCEHSDYSEDT